MMTGRFTGVGQAVGARGAFRSHVRNEFAERSWSTHRRAERWSRKGGLICVWGRLGSSEGGGGRHATERVGRAREVREVGASQPGVRGGVTSGPSHRSEGWGGDGTEGTGYHTVTGEVKMDTSVFGGSNSVPERHKRPM